MAEWSSPANLVRVNARPDAPPGSVSGPRPAMYAAADNGDAAIICTFDRFITISDWMGSLMVVVLCPHILYLCFLISYLVVAIAQALLSLGLKTRL